MASAWGSAWGAAGPALAIPESAGHTRKKIRDAVVWLLKGRTAAGPRVYSHRTQAVDIEKGMAIGVSTLDERSETYRDDPAVKSYRRTVQIAIDIFAAGAAPDDLADQLAVDVERLMEVDDTLGGLVSELSLTGSRDVYSEGGERASGRKRLTYDASYVTQAGVAEATL